jgi:hypothetical protein
MPISAAQLMAIRPSAEEEQNQLMDPARLLRECLSQQLAQLANAATSALASAAKVGFEPLYFPPPIPASPPIRRKRVRIVIDLTLDLPVQE